MDVITPNVVVTQVPIIKSTIEQIVHIKSPEEKYKIKYLLGYFLREAQSKWSPFSSNTAPKIIIAVSGRVPLSFRNSESFVGINKKMNPKIIQLVALALKTVLSVIIFFVSCILG